VSQARATLEADGVVKLKELGPTAERARVTDELRAMGFEVMKTVVRRPLEAQLSEALERGAFIPLKSIATFVRGATVAERQAAVSKLIAQGRALKVLREKVEMLVPSGTNVLSREEVTALLRALGNLSKLLTKVSKQRQASVLRADLVEQIQAAFPELLSQARARNDVPRGNGASADGILPRLLDALDATRDERLGLSFIPQVVNHLRREFTPGVVRTALIDAAGQGVIELRPEGGVNRLTKDELELCLPGPQGTRLSWARRLGGRAS